MINIGNDWDSILQDEFQKDYYKELRIKLIYEYNRYEIYPEMKDIYNALKYTSFENTKLVIIGQDPYINPGEAHGLSFSVQPKIVPPPTLLNIFKELNTDLGCYIPNNGYLINWAQQGILLLNNVLTVRRGISHSHKGIGWEIFTDNILKLLNDKKENLIFMLWGVPARKKISLITPKKHHVLESAHPSPLAGGKFFGCKHFSQANDFLINDGHKPIDWQIPNLEGK